MKYGQYLEQNLTPEWRRAYINYKSLKKLIKAVNVQQSRFANRGDSSDSEDGGRRRGSSPVDGRAEAEPTVAVGSSSQQQQVRDEQAIRRLGSLTRSSASASPKNSPRPSTVEDPAASNASSAASSLGRTTLPAASPEEGKGYGSLERSPALKGALARSGTASSRSMKKVRLDDPATSATPTSPSVRSARDDPPATDSAPPVQRLTPSSFLPPATVPRPPSSAVQPAQLPLDPIPASEASSLRLASPPSAGDRPRDPPAQAKSSPWSLLPSPRLGPSDRSPATPSRMRARKGSIASAILGDSSAMGPPRTGVLALLNEIPASSKTSTKAPDHLDEVLPSLHPAERKFVDALDFELEKVEKFYGEREGEMRRRVDNLKLQCKELAEHRRIYHATHSENAPALPHAAAAYFTSLRPILQPKKAKHAPSHSPHVTTNDADYPLSDPHDAQHYDPEAYKRYKRKLRAATAEAYKGLEVLKNYRILNLTGFRKALKKFEKASKIHLMEAYTNDRIVKQRFSNAYEIDTLIEELEDLYAARFEHGNKKTARERLRVQASSRSHHFSMFRSGIMIGVAFPTAIHAIVLSFHADTHRAIPAWAGLLQVYGAFFLPVVFALLFFLNLQAWVRYRINWKFIFELDIRTVMDHRQFLEIPAFLFVTLSFCFWFSFNLVGASNVAPTTWPLAWLVMTAVLFINPLPIMHRPARYWLIRTLYRVLTPGLSRVEFSAFFLADELNSLIYTLYNIWFLGCAQSKGWPEDVFQQCNNYNSWVVVVISILPPLARLLQCVQRWRDSGVGIQLVNAGKYLSTIVTFICFYLWRGRGSSQSDTTFPAWVLFATITSLYTSAWDLLIDWSVMNPKARFLRTQQIYSDKAYAYYFAIVTNVCIRFIWIGYVDSHGVLNLRLRAFVFYALEMLRRFQWNFYRVENEMIGNIDSYRVTKELPLPYDLTNQAYDDADSSDGGEDDPGQSSPRASVRLAKVATDGSSAGRRRATGGGKANDEESALA